MSDSCLRSKKDSKRAWESHQEERILSDIEQFDTNVKEVPRTEQNAYILDLAAQYNADTRYWLDQKDYVTAFGCINYAHGLIDAFRKAGQKDD